MANEGEYTVGYRKPPEASRFRKNHSGNPSGRPKGSKNFKTILNKVLSEPVVVNENGKRKKISKREAVLKQLTNKAVSGDARSIQILLPEIHAVDDRVDSSTAEGGRLEEADKQVLRQIYERVQRTPQTGGSQNGTDV